MEAQFVDLLEPSIHTTGTLPEDLVIADFDQDGILDFAVANSNVFQSTGVDQVSVFRGLGGGDFASQTLVTVGGAPEALAAGFFNNDSCLDLVTANFVSSSLSIRLGVPTQAGCTGGFTAGATINRPGMATRGVVVADFDGDGRDDLATTNYDDDSVTIFLGNGDGTFVLGQTYSVGTAPEMIVKANLNGDTFLDLVTVNNTTNNVSILHGQGDGTFVHVQDVSVGNFPRFVKAVDLDEDGFDDLLVADHLGGTVVILRNDAGNDYVPTTVLSAAVASGPININTADLNGDGNLDVVVTFIFTDMVAIFPGLGGFSFATPQILPVHPQGLGSYGIGIADLDDDDRLDLVISNADSNNVFVYLAKAPPVLTSLSIAPPVATVGVGSSQTFVATGHDQYGEVFSTTVAWSVSGGGSIVDAPAVPTGNLALGRPAIASSVEVAQFAPALAVDGIATSGGPAPMRIRSGYRSIWGASIR